MHKPPEQPDEPSHDEEAQFTQFLNNVVGNDYDKEHAFFVYWLGHLEQNGTLSHRDLEVIVSHMDWIEPIGNILGKLCMMGTLTTTDTEWLLTILPLNSHAFNQVCAFKTLYNNEDWETRLDKLLDLKTDWAVQYLLKKLSPEDYLTAEALIKGSQRPKRAKNDLLIYLKRLSFNSKF